MSDLPSPPFVHIPGIANFRDAGGQTTRSGQNVRRGLIYRSADPSKATEEGLSKMGKELGKVCFRLPPILSSTRPAHRPSRPEDHLRPALRPGNPA